jgi:hypothetical protein
MASPFIRLISARGRPQNNKNSTLGGLQNRQVVINTLMSLTHLQSFPIKRLKIDRAFITDLGWEGAFAQAAIDLERRAMRRTSALHA